MKIDIKDKFKIATPEVGMWLTDGESVSDKVYMPLSADASKWREITTAEKEAVEAEIERKAKEIAEPVYEPTGEEIRLKNEQEIASLKAELATYDYIGVKIATGCATIEEYADKIAYCEKLRANIREIEAEMQSMQE